MIGYLASVEYTMPDESKQLYSPVGIAWLNKNRCISACFASVAKRMRTTSRERPMLPIRAKMQVISLQGDIVFKRIIDLRSE